MTALYDDSDAERLNLSNEVWHGEPNTNGHDANGTTGQIVSCEVSDPHALKKLLTSSQMI